jgi:hypothetical protein
LIMGGFKVVRGRDRRWGSALAALAVLGSATITGVGPAAAGTEPAPHIVISMSSDLHDWIGQHTQLFLDSAVVAVAGPATPQQIRISADPGWEFNFSPGSGKAFAVRTYGLDTGIDTGPWFPGLPSMNVVGPGRGCSTTQQSWFQILDLAETTDQIQRFDLVFVQHCEGRSAAAFGEVRYNEPDPAGWTLSTRHIAWPDTEPGHAATPAALTIRNDTGVPAPIGPATIGGAGSAAFTVSGCSARVLAPGASCQLQLGFTPPGRTPYAATLTMPVGAQSATVALRGSSGDGRTSLRIDGFLGINSAGGHYLFSSANSLMLVQSGGSGSPQQLEIIANNTDTNWWNLRVSAPLGKPLSVGTFSASRYPTATTAGLDLGGQGAGCSAETGTITIRQVAAYSIMPSLSRFDAVFTTHCDGSSQSINGQIQLRSTLPPVYEVRSYAFIATSRVGGAVYVNGLTKQNDTTGVLTRSGNRPIYLQQQYAGYWRTILQRTTSPAGQVAVGFMQKDRLYYRWYLPPYGGYPAATSSSVLG